MEGLGILFRINVPVPVPVPLLVPSNLRLESEALGECQPQSRHISSSCCHVIMYEYSVHVQTNHLTFEYSNILPIIPYTQ